MSSYFSVVCRKAVAWHRRPWIEKCWFFPSYLLLGLARLALLIVPFNAIAPHLGRSMQTAAVVPLASAAESALALQIGRSIRMAARYTPWESKCLAQAVVATQLLALRRVPYVLYLGVSPDGQGSMKAHAWVCTGSVAVTGGHSFNLFTVVGSFVSARVLHSVN